MLRHQNPSIGKYHTAFERLQSARNSSHSLGLRSNLQSLQDHTFDRRHFNLPTTNEEVAAIVPFNTGAKEPRLILLSL